MIGERIKELRQWKGMTQKELCKGICDRSLLSKIESGTTLPSIPLLTELSKRLGVELSYIVPEDENISDSSKSMTEFMDTLLSDNEYDQVIRYGVKILKMNKINKNQNRLSHCSWLIGLAYHAKGDYQTAKEYFSAAVEEAKYSSLTRYISYLNSLSASLINLGQHDDALRNLEDIYELSRLFPIDIRTKIKTMFNIAKIHKKFGRINEAKRYLQNGLLLGRREGILDSSGHFETLLGLVYLDEHNVTKAITCFKKAGMFYAYVNDIEGQVGAYINLAEATLIEGEQTKALQFAQIAKELWSGASTSIPESRISEMFEKIHVVPRL